MKYLAALILVSELLISILGTGQLFAASDETTIRLFVGSDTTPPTTPEFTDVIPISDDQIDVTWTAVTDDISLSGYRLFRDGIQIATTTLTTYSDTGLTASTTYTYTVDAYDWVGNISSTSLPVATTTLEIVIPPVATTTPEEGNSTASIAHARLLSLEVIPSVRSAVIVWDTSTPTQYVIKWGRTTSYELGAVSGGIFKRQHETIIGQLEPGTRYFYELTMVNGRGFSEVASRGEFTTTALFSTERPPNVTNFTALPVDQSVQLSWQNPIIDDLAYVRVVRSHLFYPEHPFDGALVYQGTAEQATDALALAERSPQYYTVFVYDTDGNISSGAVAVARSLASQNDTGVSLPGVGTTTPPTEPIGDDSVLSAAQVLIIQGSVLQTLEESIRLDSMSAYLIQVPFKAVPPHLKTIVVSVQDPSDNKKVSAYLLRLNAEGDAYETVIAPPLIEGSSRITLEVYDYTAATVRRITNTLIFTSGSSDVFFPDRLISSMSVWPIFIIAFLSFVLFLIVFRHRRSHE